MHAISCLFCFVFAARHLSLLFYNVIRIFIRYSCSCHAKVKLHQIVYMTIWHNNSMSDMSDMSMIFIFSFALLFLLFTFTLPFHCIFIFCMISCMFLYSFVDLDSYNRYKNLLYFFCFISFHKKQQQFCNLQCIFF